MGKKDELNSTIRSFLEERKNDGNLRKLTPLLSKDGILIKVNGKTFINFSSNDYLGLSQHPEMVKTAKEAAEKFGAGSSSSRLLTGDNELFQELEEKMANFKKKESALVFNSGYQANVGIISALFGKGDAIFSDRLVHASVIDGILLSGAKHFRFKHNDTAHLEELLNKERAKYKNALIVTESVFSMDGDIAPLKEISRLKEKYDCLYMVDEAHATGIFGSSGSGMIEETGLNDQVDLIMGTFSKALGSFGAYLACSKLIKEYLINTCRSFIYSTALPPTVIACNIKSLELVEKEPERRASLLELSKLFRETLLSKGFHPAGSSQIIPLIAGENAKAVSMSEKLRSEGFWVQPIRYPTVPKGEARLRFSLNYGHTKEMLLKVINTLNGKL